MRYLLDTCTALWYFEGSDRIPVAIQDMLTDPGNELYVSHASLLEIVIKHSLGKLHLAKAPSRLIPALVRRHGMDMLPIDADSIFRLEKLPEHHRDPFDRLLIAQALVHGMTLVTPDPLIRQYRVAVEW